MRRADQNYKDFLLRMAQAISQVPGHHAYLCHVMDKSPRTLQPSVLQVRYAMGHMHLAHVARLTREIKANLKAHDRYVLEVDGVSADNNLRAVWLRRLANELE